MSMIPSGLGMMPQFAGNPMIQKLIQQMQTSSDQANTDSLAQYKSLLSSVKGTGKSILGPNGYLSQAGQTATADTKEGIANAQGSLKNDLIDKGIYSTTVNNNLSQGIANKGQRELNSIQENVGQQKAGAAMDLGRLSADSILSKQIQHPDLSMFMNLIQSLSGGHQNMFSNQGSISGMNGPSSTFGASPNYGSAMQSRPGDNYFSNAGGAGANFSSYSPGLTGAMQYPNLANSLNASGAGFPKGITTAPTQSDPNYFRM